MRETLSCNPTKPVYGISLEEHLRVTNRDIAQVLEACICFLLETGLDEEVIICSIPCLVWAFNTYKYRDRAGNSVLLCAKEKIFLGV